MYKIKIAHYNPTLFTTWVKNQPCLLTDLEEKPGTLLHRQKFPRNVFSSQMRSPVSPFLRYFPVKDFPSGPMAKNPPSNAGGTGSIPCQDIYLMQLVEKKKIVAVKQFSSLRGQIHYRENTESQNIVYYSVHFSSVQSLSHVRLFATPWIAASQASLSITNSRSSLRLMSIESVMPSSHLILCCPLFLLPPIPPSITVFSNESTLRMWWPKYWSFSFSVIPSKEIPGLISFSR